MTDEVHQIVITRSADDTFKVNAMGCGKTLETEECEKGAVLPIVAALLSLLRTPAAQCLWVAIALAGLFMGQAGAQHHHDQGHDEYLHWFNKNDVNCCNNQDCGKLSDSDERMSRGVIEIRVGDEWCPVLPHHYLKKGNTPDWSVSHACIRKHSIAADTSPCDRLLCYQPRPGS